MTQLGQACAGGYSVVVTYPCGNGTLVVLDGLTDLSWGRDLDDVSTAQATVAIPGASPDCCSRLGDVRSWCHELQVFRDGVFVWSGVVTSVSYSPDVVTINARDAVAWLDRTPIELPYSATADLSAHADAILRQHVDLGNAAGCLLTDVRPTGIRTARKVERYTGYVGDQLRDLARAGLDFTVLGRLLVLFGATPLSTLTPLTDRHFLQDLSVTEEGLAGATRAIVVGKGVVGRYETEGACGVVGVIRKDESITTQDDANRLAYRIVQGGYPTPVVVDVPSGAQLAPDAPVTIEQLVPGVAVPLYVAATCREMNTVLRLTSLLVQVGPENESVQVTLSPASADLSGFDDDRAV